jgi:hypothetical protein
LVANGYNQFPVKPKFSRGSFRPDVSRLHALRACSACVALETLARIPLDIRVCLAHPASSKSHLNQNINDSSPKFANGRTIDAPRFMVAMLRGGKKGGYLAGRFPAKRA